MALKYYYASCQVKNIASNTGSLSQNWLYRNVTNTFLKYLWSNNNNLKKHTKPATFGDWFIASGSKATQNKAAC